MNWNELVLNRKGFIHHPETPEQDRVAYSQNRIKAQQLLQIAMDFIQSNGVLSHRSIPQGKELLGTKSKFLHRGVFCPSPVLDILITNSKRGKILVRPTKKSNITNKYVYDESNRLIWVDNYIDNRIVSSEYLLYQSDAIYGITIGMSGRLLSVSEERYANKRIENYICAYYSGEDCEIQCYQVHLERYHYEECGLAGWDYYEIYYSWEHIAASGFIRHNRYRLTQEDGWLKSFVRVNIDGTAIEGAEYTEIKVKRKA